MAFLGIKINHDIGRLLQGLEVPGVKESPSQYHITLLCFEDDLSISEISKSMEATFNVVSEIKPFVVKTDTITSFPKREGHPIPIIAKVEGQELHDLREKLAKKFDKEGINFSKTFKDFKPHITLAYYDSDKGIEESKIDELEFSVNEVVLWGGDNGDDRLFITFALKSPELKKSSLLFQKCDWFFKSAKSLNSYKYSQATVDDILDLYRTDYETELDEFKRLGAWAKYSFKILPVNQLEVKPVWSKDKLNNVLNQIDNDENIYPIRVVNEDGKYVVEDGIHRVAASKIRGLTSIPAICEEWIKTPPTK